MPQIILLHGALGSKQDLAPLAESLHKEHLQVHCFEFSGHGESDFSAEFNIPQFTAELAQFIEHKNLSAVGLFGYSMGGYVALNLARSKPQLINKIVTLGTKFIWNEEITKKETALLNPQAIKEKVPKLAEALKNKHGEKWEEHLHRTAALMRNISNAQYLNDAALKEIKHPALIGLADRDKMVTYEETAHVYKTLPNAGMFMLPHSQHPLETVNISLLSKIITDFLKQNF